MTRLAERQFGVVSRAQLGTCGVTNGGVTRWIEDGRLHRVHRGVYAVGHRALSSEGQLAAALLRAGPGAALSHITAGWWWGILAERGDVVDVSAPGRGASFPGVRVHHPRGLLRAWHRGLPVTPVPAALLDMSSQLSYRELRRALAEALYRDLTDLASVRLALGRGHRGSTALARAIASHEPRLARTRSVLEERFLELCEEAALPIPAVNVKIGPITVDALWAEQRVVVELDGQRSHGAAVSVARDRQRELSLRAVGYSVLRYGWRQITERPDDVAADLRSALAVTAARRRG